MLCGYMGSGKTTVARLLGKATGLQYLDLDTLIEQKAGKTISQIFAEDGEISFRKLEHETLKEIAGCTQGFVLALGGGTPCYANNHLFLRQEDVVSVYLKASVATLAQRLGNATQGRPLLQPQDATTLEDYIAKHLFDRSYYYHQAKHVVATDGQTPEAVVNNIMSLF